jgi:hypothetical protein
VQLDSVSIARSQFRPRVPSSGAEDARLLTGRQLAGIAFVSLFLCSVANCCLAHWLGLSRSAPWINEALYRRIGPETGPQVFCAGSSLLISGLSWPNVSESLGQGIETWTVAGSSPEVWEVFQQQSRNINTTIVGVSVYDLNEMRLTPDRARYVSVRRTIGDLWASGTASTLGDRIVTQYVMLYLRYLYPMAGDADKVLVAIRRKAAELFGLQALLGDYEGVVVEQKGVLNVEDSMLSLGDWSSARILRRATALREENHGSHVFSDGPKSRALHRILSQAQQGQVIIVVFPVSQAYNDAFLDNTSLAAFERALDSAMAFAPNATLVRLDQVPGISDNKNFYDLVHLNSAGRRVLTSLFLNEINKHTSQMKSANQLRQAAVNHLALER